MPLLRLRGAGDRAAAGNADPEEAVFRPRVLEEELGDDSFDTRARDSKMFETTLHGEDPSGQAEGAQGLLLKKRDTPLQPPPGVNEKWEDMEMSDKLVHYIKARIIEENQRPEIQNWWRGPAKGR